jgi:N-acetylneuraminate synthase
MINAHIEIEGRLIGPGKPPYLVAEISANHKGRLNAALELIDAAKYAGADAVKFQTYTPDTITIDEEGPGFCIRGGLWDRRTLYDLYDEAHTPYEWHADLFAHARELGLHAFSSPFDESAVELLEQLGTPAYKIASFEAVDLPLIRRAAATGKPLIISIGMADQAEIEAAVGAARGAGCEQLALLHCVSAYPAPAEDYNLGTIPDMAQRFGVVSGLSDHTLGTAVSVAAVALGAALVEKHFTDDRNSGGPDAAFSLEPIEFRKLCEDCRCAYAALGEPHYQRRRSEELSAKFRRSLYVVEDVAAGELFTPRNVRSIRPGYGLAPSRFNDVIGRPALRDVKRGTPVSEDLLGE